MQSLLELQAVNSLLGWAFFSIEDMEALPKYRKRVAERVAAGLCLDNRKTDENPTGKECEKESGTRGVCKHHHHAFLMEKLGTDKDQREAYDKNRVLKGTILPPRQGQGGGRPRKQRAKAS